MLAQAMRVARSKMRWDRSGMLMVYSRVHQRNDRYFKTREEGDSEIGLRLEQLGSFLEQLGLIVQDEDCRRLTPEARSLLEAAG